ncbi:MAG: enoyl-CoA hydratase-related protein [archaeon]|nr:enoyl-CoA hydratase-related protein [archaeon]MDA1168255.1 enoyl-CoA hydratase-related protein [archaeon]
MVMRVNMQPPNHETVAFEMHEVNQSSCFALLTISRPEKLNALNQDVMTALVEYCSFIEQEDSIRCVVITGAAPPVPEEGKRPKPHAFVAGADITEFVDKTSNDRPIFAMNGWEALWNLSKPTIAMVDGFALGGGCEIACSCDIRIASNRSKFGTPEINLGLIPGGGGTQRLSSLIGYAKTMEMVYTGEMIDAQEAKDIGLVNHVLEPDELQNFTFDLASKIASKSSHTLGVAKKVIRAALDVGLSEGICIEEDEFALLFDTEDKNIGVRAFLERTQPEWKHK